MADTLRERPPRWIAVYENKVKTTSKPVTCNERRKYGRRTEIMTGSVMRDQTEGLLPST